MLKFQTKSYLRSENAFRTDEKRLIREMTFEECAIEYQLLYILGNNYISKFSLAVYYWMT